MNGVIIARTCPSNVSSIYTTPTVMVTWVHVPHPNNRDWHEQMHSTKLYSTGSLLNIFAFASALNQVSSNLNSHSTCTTVALKLNSKHLDPVPLN